MKSKIFLLIICLFPACIAGFAQGYPNDYFSAPLDTPLSVVGTFGEIRNGHFHSGLDLSTGEQTGVPVMAAADGYISRIKIQAEGFGKALYVTHPNGFVTVYAHLEKFTSPVNDLVRNTQYAQKSFEVEIFPKSKDFRVKKGEVIAYSGNSGSSEGPHLHFEIRDKDSEEPINPLLFGLKMKDHIAPTIRFVRAYPLREAGFVNNTDSAETFEVMEQDGIPVFNMLGYIQAWGVVSVGFEAIDHEDQSQANLGIYSAELYVNATLAYQWKMDRFNFNDTHYANAQSDYQTRKRDGVNIERCFRLPGNHLESIYRDTSLLGYFDFVADSSHDFKLVVKDFNGNTKSFEFQILAYASLMSNSYQPRPPGAVIVSPAKGIAIHKNDLDVVIPSGAVFKDVIYSDSKRKGPDYLSDIFTVGDMYEALDEKITVGIKPDSIIPDNLKSKTAVAYIEPTGKMHALEGNWRGDMIFSRSSRFGDFAVLIDTVPPKVEKEYVPADMNTYRGGIVQVRISDDVSDISSYSGSIDGKWFLFEYDPKSSMLTADLSAIEHNKRHDIEVTATDSRGNVGTWKSTFWY
ncbi:MAG: M23 family metallopeptidase [Bacteroidia bacterium]|nr:M23 family metallopeptidase [Bacteroidia bacterium]